jgi:hypothetical protein
MFMGHRVSDRHYTTLEYDRDVKARLHARAGIPETWVVDLTGARMIVFHLSDYPLSIR